ncbi:hypothetical protein KIN20_023521 [Parelaphostrongylus tenuis]|uniref:Uncharacterized protein n=1 Tax=Parelaphostrongylus tenuis TaxID=148309 RepID=A0AAD5N947_PARTN|nr:hypothetical protein KIN20_023521 [Parelaphostrongylus tenuis]
MKRKEKCLVIRRDLATRQANLSGLSQAQAHLRTDSAIFFKTKRLPPERDQNKPDYAEL